MNSIKKHGWLIFFLAALLSTAVIGAVFVFGNIMTATAGGLPVEAMDGRYFYSPDTVYTTLNLLGANGRREYLTFHILDYFFLLAYGMLMAACLKPLVSQKHKWIYIVFPLLPAGFDLIENTLIRVASAAFPQVIPGLATAISIFTPLKWGTGVLWFLVFLAAAGLRISQKIRAKKQTL